MYRLGTRALGALDPETAHNATIALLSAGFGPRCDAKTSPMLRNTVAGIDVPNPIGLAAGFDKNARAPDAALALGFGFVEVGAVTPRPQAGNDRPRVFRLRHEKAVINRYGFNNDGLDAVKARLAARAGRPGVVGVNLGANKDSEDKAADYVTGLEALSPFVDFCTVNVSSPNTPGLRALQGREALEALLSRVMAAKSTAKVFLKIAPDLTDADKADIVAAAQGARVDGLIVSNTTTRRKEGLSRHASEQGGLSGRPLFAPSTEILREIASALGGTIPLIGVGGVSSARDAYEKIAAGASLVQLYTALVYEGPGLVGRMLRELPDILRAEGHEDLAGAVGCKMS